ncbi:MAG: hypothetical protein RJA99_1856 [Pseudomonadota bacterium]|jgi:GntR family transcriptional repressor for pyruvate dehydrogenase complex
MNDPRLAVTDGPAAFRFSAVPPRQSLVDSVVGQLAAQIESGGAAPGSRLPAETDLCRQFGVSRTVVREAIARLKADQLVETQPGLGLFVVRRAPGQGVLRLRGSEGTSVERAREMLEFRAGLETEAARLAAIRRTDQDRAAIRAALARIEEVERGGGNGGAEDLALHMAIARASRNGYIVQVLQFLAAPLAEAISASRTLSAQPREDSERARAEHRLVIEAIDAGDPEIATLQMRRHLANGEHRLLQVQRRIAAA